MMRGILEFVAAGIALVAFVLLLIAVLFAPIILFPESSFGIAVMWALFLLFVIGGVLWTLKRKSLE